jgi:hypothetical protein
MSLALRATLLLTSSSKVADVQPSMAAESESLYTGVSFDHINRIRR